MKNLVDSLFSVNGKNRFTMKFILEKSFMKPIVGNYIFNFEENWKERGGKKNVGILWEQDEKFCFFEVSWINEIFGKKYINKNENKAQEDLKDINENEKQF